MPLDPQAKAFLDQIASMAAPPLPGRGRRLLRRYDGMIHGFFGMSAIMDTAKPAIADASAALRRAYET